MFKNLIAGTVHPTNGPEGGFHKRRNEKSGARNKKQSGPIPPGLTTDVPSHQRENCSIDCQMILFNNFLFYLIRFLFI